MAEQSDDIVGDHIPTSDFTRPDPEAILTDETDPDNLLGADSESEGSVSSRRASRARSKRVSNLTTVDLDGKSSASTATPTQRTFTTQQPAQASSSVFPSSADEDQPTSVAELQTLTKDLSTQVITLNTKLVRSFERVADLEDDVSEAHTRIQSHTARIAELEKEREQHLAALNTGLLVEKEHVSTEMQRMMDKLLEETAQKGKAMSDKEAIEAELEQLSASLFGEANKMVAVERLARAQAEEKSKHMEERMKDTEGIILEQSHVVSDLQRRLEEAQQSAAAAIHASSSSNSNLTSTNSFVMQLSPTHLRPTLQINVVPYGEFMSFLAYLRKLRRQLAPFYTFPLLASGAAISRPNSPAISGSAPANTTTFTGSGAFSQGLNGPTTSNPFIAAGVGRHKDYPSLPSNADQLVLISSQLSSQAFLKRALEEDVEPALRLDRAPGLNWLSRRQANTAILDGQLVIEPVWPGGSPPVDENATRAQYAHLPPAACALCGTTVVNVPLPDTPQSGGEGASSSSSSSAATTGRSTSSLASLGGSWASSISAATGSAASSLREVTSTTSSASSSKDEPSTPKSRGLFSSLRIGVSSKDLNSSFNQQAASGTGDKRSTGSGPEPTTPTQDGPDGVHIGFVAPLPIPTHIFRLSETSTHRYLLCPHHCLARLRSACAFWGFVRSLERQIVLEGKNVRDEETGTRTIAPSASAPSLPPKDDPTAVSKGLGIEDGETALQDSTAGTSDTPLTPSSPEHANKDLDNVSLSESEDGFADADDGTAGIENDEESANDTADKSKDSQAAPSTPTKTPPPLPRRSTARSASTPAVGGGLQTPPSLPPRSNNRSPMPPPSAAAQQASQDAAPLVRMPLARTTVGYTPLGFERVGVRLDGAKQQRDSLTWEEKSWLEVVRLKEEMWHARNALDYTARVEEQEDGAEDEVAKGGDAKVHDDGAQAATTAAAA